jgi:NAD(P)-dependent dehydrogenase (short-subunit alcohol dehydrogenase family)
MDAGSAASDLKGKTYVITGGNSGLGLEAAKLLAGKGGARGDHRPQPGEGAEAVAHDPRGRSGGGGRLRAARSGRPRQRGRRRRRALRAACPRIDAIINNAGVMQTPLLRTKQGFELQIGTNHFGHFKLNSALFDVLEASGARIVPVASVAHEMGAIDLADLDYERRAYDPTQAYCQSKLANVMYGFELQRRLAARGSRVTSIPCHPGLCRDQPPVRRGGHGGRQQAVPALYSGHERGARPVRHGGRLPARARGRRPDGEAGRVLRPHGPDAGAGARRRVLGGAARPGRRRRPGPVGGHGGPGREVLPRVISPPRAGWAAGAA